MTRKSSLSSALLDLVYPPTCMHCKELLIDPSTFCEKCLENFTLLSEEGHCGKCFGEIPTVLGICKPCRKLQHPLRKLSTCFDAYGPAQSLVNAFRSQDQLHLAKDIAAYMIIQLNTLSFPEVDLVVPIPNHFQNPQFAVAKEVARLLNKPFQPILKRHFLPSAEFSLKEKNRCDIINKRVLLVDITMQTRATIRAAGWALKKGLPENIYGITFCAF